MTIATDLFPQQDYSELYSTDPITYVADEGLNAQTVTAAGLALGAAFLMYRALFAYRLRISREDLTMVNVKAAQIILYRQLAPSWVQMAAPALMRAYKLGAPELTEDEALKLANDYATSLGEYIHGTSAQALTEGYQALLNRGWSPEMAFIRARDAYGLDSAQMKSYVSSLEATRKTVLLTNTEQLGRDASQALLDRFLAGRAQVIGANEAWTVSQMAKQVIWLTEQENGFLSALATKRWVTADDERVCPVCRPLDGEEVWVNQQFKVEGKGQLWGPAAHVNCRCTMILIVPPEEVNKANDFDPNEHPRGGDPKNRGRFSPQRQRAKKAAPPRLRPVMERGRTAAQEMVDEALQQAQEVVTPVAEPVIEESPFASPFAQSFADTSPFTGDNPFVESYETSPFTEPLSPFAQAISPFAESISPFRAERADQALQVLINLLKRKPIIPHDPPPDDPLDYHLYRPFFGDWEWGEGDKLLIGKFSAGHNWTPNETHQLAQMLAINQERWRALHTYMLANEHLADNWKNFILDDLTQQLRDASPEQIENLVEACGIPVYSSHRDIMIDDLLTRYTEEEVGSTVENLEDWFKDSDPEGFSRLQKEWIEQNIDMLSSRERSKLPSVLFADGTKATLLTDYIPTMLVIDNGMGKHFEGIDAESEDPAYSFSGRYQVAKIDYLHTGTTEDNVNPFLPQVRYVHLVPYPEPEGIPPYDDDVGDEDVHPYQDDTPPHIPPNPPMGDIYD